MTNKIERNKREKEEALLEAGHKLFTKKGINKTSIDEIVEEAGVAKGTFYLYYKNKYKLLEELILRNSTRIVKEAIEATKREEIQDFNQKVIFYVDYIVDFFTENVEILEIVYKNFSWPFLRENIKDKEEIKEVFQMFKRGYEGREISDDELKATIFVIIEITSSLCYSSLVLGKPKKMEEVKPFLYELIDKIIKE